MTSFHARDAAASGPDAAPSPFADLQEQARRLAGSTVFVRLLAALVATDAVLILLHVLHSLHDMRIIGADGGADGGGFLLESRRFLIDEELGYGEIFGYLKSLAIAAALFACYRRALAPAFAALAFTFAVIALDDSLRIHEFFGNLIAKGLALGPAFGLRAQDVGELMVWSALGAVVVSALAYGYRRSNAAARSLASIFLGLLAVLVFFAVVADMLHIALAGWFRGAYRVGTVIEEGGEMLTLSLICAAAVAAFALRPRNIGRENRVSVGRTMNAWRSPVAKDAIQLLKDDHAKVKELLSKLAETGERATKARQDLLNTIQAELEAHTAIEEEIFYPAFKKAGAEKEDDKLFYEAKEEHRAVEKLVLPDLIETDAGTVVFAGRAKVLKDLIEHHAEEEEKEMFPRAKKLLSKEQLMDLGSRMAARKEELLAATA